MNVSRQAVSKWENGQSLPDSLKMIHLAEVLNTDIEYLTTGRINERVKPPAVIKSTQTVERTVEVPVIKIVEKPVEKIVEKTVVQYIDKPIVKRVIRTIRKRNPLEFIALGIVTFFLGFILGISIF